MKPTNFSNHLTVFLSSYLTAQRNVSPNTIKTYRDAFVLLLRFCRDVRGLPPERLSIEQVDPPLVLAFLEYLEKERKSAVRTRNVRLAALHSFFRYLQTEEPACLLQCQRILAIPVQRHQSRVIGYLPPDALATVLKQPDLTTLHGRRDAVLLSLLYDTGARVQELIDLSVRNLHLESPAQIRIVGKGRKVRIVPLMDSIVKLLRNYIVEQGIDRPERLDEPLFQNRHAGRLSRSGIRYILEKYTQRIPQSLEHVVDKVTPHTLRHTKAMHLLQSGNPLVVIRDILGHADVKSTEIYAKADLNMKRQALERANEKSATPVMPSWQKNKDLLKWLHSL